MIIIIGMVIRVRPQKGEIGLANELGGILATLGIESDSNTIYWRALLLSLLAADLAFLLARYLVLSIVLGYTNLFGRCRYWAWQANRARLPSESLIEDLKYHHHHELVCSPSS